MDAAALAGLNSFGIFDVEADRLDHFFAGLDAPGWARPSRCAGWSVHDVLAHLAGAELYNHACLNGGLDGFRDAPLLTAAGPYPAGLQAFHCSSDYATHADDVGAPVAPGEEPGRTPWRVGVAAFAPDEQNSPVKIFITERPVLVHLSSVGTELLAGDFVAATVGRLPPDYSLDPALRDALRCLA
jgi:mycothiol maleylpyruvate isomerase-like protein